MTTRIAMIAACGVILAVAPGNLTRAAYADAVLSKMPPQSTTSSGMKSYRGTRNYPCGDFNARTQTCGRAANQEPNWMLAHPSRSEF